MGKRVGDDTRARAVVLALEVRDLSRTMEWLAGLAHYQGYVQGFQDGATAVRTLKKAPRRSNPYLDAGDAPE